MTSSFDAVINLALSLEIICNSSLNTAYSLLSLIVKKVRDQSIEGGITYAVTIDYLSGTSFLLIRTTQRMFPLGLCQYLEDRYVFSLGPRCFSFVPFPPDAPTPVPLLLFSS